MLRGDTFNFVSSGPSSSSFDGAENLYGFVLPNAARTYMERLELTTGMQSDNQTLTQNTLMNPRERASSMRVRRLQANYQEQVSQLVEHEKLMRELYSNTVTTSAQDSVYFERGSTTTVPTISEQTYQYQEYQEPAAKFAKELKPGLYFENESPIPPKEQKPLFGQKNMQIQTALNKMSVKPPRSGMSSLRRTPRNPRENPQFELFHDTKISSKPLPRMVFNPRDAKFRALNKVLRSGSGSHVSSSHVSSSESTQISTGPVEITDTSQTRKVSVGGTDETQFAQTTQTDINEILRESSVRASATAIDKALDFARTTVKDFALTATDASRKSKPQDLLINPKMMNLEGIHIDEHAPCPLCGSHSGQVTLESLKKWSELIYGGHEPSLNMNL